MPGLEVPPWSREFGGTLVPDALPGAQSFIALGELLLIPPLLVPLLAPLDPVLEPIPPELELWAADEPPGPQSVLREVPLIEPEVVPVPVAPVLGLVWLVCAIAAVPNVKARIDAAVRRRRFIRFLLMEAGCP